MSGYDIVNCPTRWSLSFIFVFLCWSSIFPIPDTKKYSTAMCYHFTKPNITSKGHIDQEEKNNCESSRKRKPTFNWMFESSGIQGKGLGNVRDLSSESCSSDIPQKCFWSLRSLTSSPNAFLHWACDHSSGRCCPPGSSWSSRPRWTQWSSAGRELGRSCQSWQTENM